MRDDGEEGFACDDGLCIDISGVCNKIPNCDDGTDESKGCDLYPDTGKWASRKMWRRGLLMFGYS